MTMSVPPSDPRSRHGEFRAAFNGILLDSLGSLATGLTVLFAVFALLNLLAVSGSSGRFTAVLDGSVAAVFLALRQAFARGLIRAQWAHPVGVGMAALILADILLTLARLADPTHAVYVVILIIGVGCFLLSVPWLVLTLAGIWAAWLLVAWPVSSRQELFQYCLALIAASALSLLIHGSRLHTHGRVEGLRRRDEEHKRELEKALLESEDRYRQIVETAHEGIGVVDSAGRLTYANSRLAAMVGSTLATVVGQYFIELVVEEDRGEVERRLTAVCNGVSDQFECRLAQPGGASRWCLVSSGPVLDADGSVAGCLVLLSDITERKAAEERLQQSQKMEALGQLAGGIAHDFNNLLMAIEGSAGVLRLCNPGDPTLTPALDTIHRAVRRGSDLTQRLLAAGRQQFLEAVDLDLNRLIEQEVRMLRRLIPESIAIEFRPAPALPAVRADRGQLLQVLMNLCVNARDAMAAGGTIAIETSEVVADSDFLSSHPDAGESRYVCLELTDTGVGMDRETQARVFEPFFTTKGTGKGTGLGLATVYGIIKQHNGLIEIDSEQGRGTSFRIYLPALDRTPERTDSSGAVLALGQGETILVVEDDTDVRNLVVQALGELGYRPIQAADGEEALGMIERERVDLVLTDVVMPRMDGQELFKRCREMVPEIAFVFSSGYTAEALPEGLGTDTGVPFVTKPYTIEKLASKVKQALSARPK